MGVPVSVFNIWTVVVNTDREQYGYMVEQYHLPYEPSAATQGKTQSEVRDDSTEKVPPSSSTDKA